ncbi:MAG: Coenzyme F420 hydrogenase/dehydrogenase, beta subunit C-terminal domain [Phycisphaerales bacterium]
MAELRIIEEIVGHDCCVGCGMCVAAAPEHLEMYETPHGTYEARRTQLSLEGRAVGGSSVDAPIDPNIGLDVCPFTDGPPNEDAIGAERFGDTEGVGHSPEIGYRLDLWAGTVRDEGQRLGSSSGGIITWIASELLRSGAVDAIACVGPTPETAPDTVFGYRLVRTPEELLDCRGSRYYPISADAVIQELRGSGLKIAFIGLPCFIKGLHRLARVDPEVKDMVAFTIGLFCGHLKSKRYAEYLTRATGADETKLATVDFRHKLAGRAASDYAFEATTIDGTTSQIRMREVFGGRWGYNLFMLGACNWCDDVMAETADVAVGDAWIPPYTDDHRGTSMVVVRHPAIRAVLAGGVEGGAVDLEALTPEQVIAAQAGGLRQRRGGLSYRLGAAKAAGKWHPTKRVSANIKSVGRVFGIVQRLRERSRQTSHAAMAEQRGTPGLAIFERRMRRWILALDGMYELRSRMGRLQRRLRGRG